MGKRRRTCKHDDVAIDRLVERDAKLAFDQGVQDIVRAELCTDVFSLSPTLFIL